MAKINLSLEVDKKLGGPDTEWGKVFPKNKRAYLQVTGNYIQEAARLNLSRKRKRLRKNLSENGVKDSDMKGTIRVRRRLGLKTKGRIASKPGKSPNTWNSIMRNSIQFKRMKSVNNVDRVAIGPVKLASSSTTAAPGVLEHGGKSTDKIPHPFNVYGLSMVRYHGQVLLGIRPNNDPDLLIQGFPAVPKARRVIDLTDNGTNRPFEIRKKPEAQKNAAKARPYMRPALDRSFKRISTSLLRILINGK